ncbi:MAG TPA: acylphosphatase [Dehalococcoidia bacterium]|jgi:acylphosphatase|nr:acylphosphatase [Dehalococcoidia bacterium]
MNERARLHAVVRGKVQMVGFRQFVIERARRLGLTGWVRNGDDGRSVEVVAEGERKGLEELLRLLHEGPRLAVVQTVDVSWDAPSGEFRDFSLRW